MFKEFRCYLCNKTFAIDNEHTSELLEHIQTVHVELNWNEKPYLNNNRSDTEYSTESVNFNRLAGGLEGFLSDPEINRNKMHSPDTFKDARSENYDIKTIYRRESRRHGGTGNSGYKRKYSVNNSQTDSPRTHVRFKTSIQKWRPKTGDCIVCPKCGAKQKPIIKSHTDKVSNSPIGAACILTCWPFCFLPCLFPPPAKETLHCSACNHYLGVYDRKAAAVKANDDLEKEGPSSEDPLAIDDDNDAPED